MVKYNECRGGGTGRRARLKILWGLKPRVGSNPTPGTISSIQLMISATQLRNGKTFQIDETPYQVLKYEHVKMGRGGATVRISARNLRTGGVEERTFSTGTTVEEIATIKRRLQYLYSDVGNAIFMDPKSYEQVEVKKGILGTQLAFLKEGQEADVLFWEDEALDIDLPPKVVLAVTETAPGVKGNSATNIYKSAVLENGLQVKVPLFIKVQDKVKVDTRTGEYVERVSKK